MDFEQMKEKAGKIIEALNEKGYDASLIEDALEPGKPLPIALVVDGVDLVLELDVL